jgi:hypothetical protein
MWSDEAGEERCVKGQGERRSLTQYSRTPNSNTKEDEARRIQKEDQDEDLSRWTAQDGDDYPSSAWLSAQAYDVLLAVQVCPSNNRKAYAATPETDRSSVIPMILRTIAPRAKRFSLVCAK